MQTSSFSCGRQTHYPQHEFQSHAPVVARSGRNVMRRQRLEELQPARILPSTCSRPRLDMRARVAEDTRVEAVIPVLPPNNVTSSMDYDSLFGSTCALGGVEQAMRATGRGILTASPKESLNSVIPKLSKVTGLPVLNLDGRVVGVISRKDIIRVRKGERPGSLQDPVEKHMTTPAITIARTASVQEAADLMLSKRIRRLPVVDDSGFPVGILSRSDIFTPLFTEGYTQFMDREAAEVQGLTVPAGAPAVQVVKKKKVTWAVKYLYDGDCAMCLSLKAVLSRQDKHKKIKYVNIASDDYNPSKNMGIEYEEAMKTIHVIRSDGEVLYGTEALRAMFNEVGLGWAANLSEWPLLNWLVDIIYNFLSANRISLGGAMDAIIAAKRVEMSKEGVESCGDLDEECKVEW